MPDYQKSKIYKIYSVSNEELVYYGSTTKTLTARLANHIYNYKNNKPIKSKIVLDTGDYKIELVENYPCANKQELFKKEAEYIKNNVSVNKVIPDRTKKEWAKVYNDINKEKMIMEGKKYYQNNKEQILEKNKKYRENNKEQTKATTKNYRANNKEKINEKITCECGCISYKFNLKRHQETPKHIKLMEDMNK